jgi:peptidoglycan-associated lipoprotein
MGLQTVHFPYDSSNLDSEAKNVLRSNAEILKTNSNVKIQIEGHCDARGGIQYNLALGERRAKSVKDYLVDAGVSGNRISTISYGKERLLDPGTSEEANAKNRRANFVITSK